MYMPESDQLSVNLCSTLIVYMSARSTVRAVSLAFGWPSSLPSKARPLTVLVGQSEVIAAAAGLSAGWPCGMMPPANSGVASEPLPVAGHRALLTPSRQYGFQIWTALPPMVDCEKSPWRWLSPGQVRCVNRVVKDR